MSQADSQIGSGESGTSYRNKDNDGKKAIINHHKGNSAPSYAEAGIVWIDDTATPWLMKVYDGADWIIICAVNATDNVINPYQGNAPLRIVKYVADTGTANHIVLTPSLAVASLVAGTIITVKPTNSTTGACDVAVSGLTAVAVKLLTGADPYSGAMTTTGNYIMMYNGTNFVLMNPTITLASLVTLGVATLGAAQTFTGGQRTNASALADSAGTTTINLNLNNDFTYTLTANTTFSFTNVTAGQKGRIAITQPASAKTITWDAKQKWEGAAPVITTTVSSLSCLYYDVVDSTHIICSLKGPVS